MSSSMSRRPIKPAIEQPIVSNVPEHHLEDAKGLLLDQDGHAVEDDTLLSPTTPTTTTTTKKRKAKQQTATGSSGAGGGGGGGGGGGSAAAGSSTTTNKRPRTNTPWTATEELRLKNMRDAGNSWSEIAKTFPTRTEGSVKKHWYKDMHYAEFGEDEVSFTNCLKLVGNALAELLLTIKYDKSAALLAAIKEYDANKWKAIGLKVGKPAKACEQYAKEHFGTGK